MSVAPSRKANPGFIGAFQDEIRTFVEYPVCFEHLL
jgi:hypothetical protein